VKADHHAKAYYKTNTHGNDEGLPKSSIHYQFKEQGNDDGKYQGIKKITEEVEQERLLIRGFKITRHNIPTKIDVFCV
jgi:hypothetical protein